MALPPVRMVGEKIYSSVASSRLCSLARREIKLLPDKAAMAPSSALRFAGLSLLAVNILCGTLHIVLSWPFACYPAFDKLQRAEITKLIAMVDMGNGHHVDYELSYDPVMGAVFSTERWHGMVDCVTRRPPGNRADIRLDAMWNVWKEHHPITGDARFATFREETVGLDLATVLSSEHQ